MAGIFPIRVTEKPCIECEYWQAVNPQCLHEKNRQSPNYRTGEGYIPHYYNSQFLRESNNYCGPEGKWFKPKDANKGDSNNEDSNT